MTEWQKYTAMAARLGSIPPSKMNALPISIQKILEEDMVFCLDVVKAVVVYRDALSEAKTDEDVTTADNMFDTVLTGLGI